MARRKKRSSYRKSSRRSRVGFLSGKSAIMDAVGLVAGASVARVLTSSEKILPNISPTIKSAGVVAIGLFFPKLLKNELGKSIGAGMVASGGLGLLQSTNILSGIGVTDTMEIPVEVMAGDDMSVMAGYTPDNLSVIAGMEEEY